MDKQKAAVILAEATLYGRHKAALRGGVTERTVRNYQERLATDSELERLFQEKKDALEVRWASHLAPAIRSSILFLQRAADEADPTDPDAIAAVSSALKTLSEIAITKEVIDARFPAGNRPHGAPLGKVAAA